MYLSTKEHIVHAGHNNNMTATVCDGNRLLLAPLSFLIAFS